MEEQTKIQKELDKNYKFIQNFVNDYCKSDEDKKEFFKHLLGLVNCEIELEKFCNQ